MKAISDIAVNERPLADQDRSGDDESAHWNATGCQSRIVRFWNLGNPEDWTEKQ